MTRWILRVMMVVWGVGMVGTVGVWGRSYWYGDHVRSEESNPRLEIRSRCGEVILIWWRYSPGIAPIGRWAWESSPVAGMPAFNVQVRKSCLGIKWGETTWVAVTGTRAVEFNSYSLILPMWFIGVMEAGVSVGMGTVWWWRRRKVGRGFPVEVRGEI